VKLQHVTVALLELQNLPTNSIQAHPVAGCYSNMGHKKMAYIKSYLQYYFRLEQRIEIRFVLRGNADFIHVRQVTWHLEYCTWSSMSS
jgi:hypothetical protein